MSGKAVVQIAAIEISVDDLLDIGSPESLLSPQYPLTGKNSPPILLSIESNILSKILSNKSEIQQIHKNEKGDEK